jgi:subtilase family protein
VRKATFFVLIAAAGAAIAPAQAARTRAPQAVIALIDVGINPYSPAFRDRSALAQLPPSRYIPGYPHNCGPNDAPPTLDCAIPLRLTFTKRTLAQDLAADRRLWAGVMPSQLYYFPGTRIIGAVSMRPGSVSCPANVAGRNVIVPPPANTVNTNPSCMDRLILDDAGHGTMTASRAAGYPHSLAPGARIVEIEGLGAPSSAWAASQPWIDVQSNSWGNAIPAPADGDDMRVFREAARRQMVMVGSGNGIAFSGLAPTPTETDGLGAPGVVLVGGHDNGHVTAWSGTPAHVVADDYAGFSAIHDSLAPMRPDPVACCTSAAAPYAAGGAAAILLEARRILGADRTGVHNGIAARGPAHLVRGGPLADGIFTLQEWRTVLLHTAEVRPQPGRDDGLLQFMGGPAGPKHPEYGAGENPYCQGCWTLPLTWAQVPAGYPAYLHIGYGAINERSVALAARVLSGRSALPPRSNEDAFFAREGQLRGALFGLPG